MHNQDEKSSYNFYYNSVTSSGFDEGRSDPVLSSALLKGKSVSIECMVEDGSVTLTATSRVVVREGHTETMCS